MFSQVDVVGFAEAFYPPVGHVKGQAERCSVRVRRKHQPPLHEMYSCLELCAGGGGQALGFECEGFRHVALVENNPTCCETLRLNRPEWPVVQQDLQDFDGKPYKGQFDVLTFGLPCPPYKVASDQKGVLDDRDLIPTTLRLIRQTRPKVVVIENVADYLAPRFKTARRSFKQALRSMKYEVRTKILHTQDFGVPQHRPRVFVVALQYRYAQCFEWPKPTADFPVPVGVVLFDLMKANGWKGAERWAKNADRPAPTLAESSSNHGGADLGPSRSRAAWQKLGVDGTSIADKAPRASFKGRPKLTLAMAQQLQGFPDVWTFVGGKAAAYRQISNACPPLLAAAMANQVWRALERGETGWSGLMPRKRFSLPVWEPGSKEVAAS